MIEKNDAINPANPKTFTVVAKLVFPVAFNASTKGTALLPISWAPVALGTKNITNDALNSKKPLQL